LRKAFRRWYWWLPAILLSGAGLYVAYRATHPPWADTEAWAKYQQLRLGMSPEEVDAILGERPTRADELDGSPTFGTWAWTDGTDRVDVWFKNSRQIGAKHAMVRGHLCADPPLKKSAWDLWCDWLGW
jgi:hypothetical protein